MVPGLIVFFWGVIQNKSIKKCVFTPSLFLFHILHFFIQLQFSGVAFYFLLLPITQNVFLYQILQSQLTFHLLRASFPSASPRWMCWNHKVYLLLLVAKSHLTLCGPMDCSTPGSSVLHCLPEFAQTHVYWVSDAIQSSHPLATLWPGASHSRLLWSWLEGWWFWVHFDTG